MGATAFSYWCLVVVAVCATVSAVRVQGADYAAVKEPGESRAFPYSSLVFIKFHKVGSSTAAIRLGAVAQQKGLKEDCRHGGDGTFCVQHDAMRQMRDGSLGRGPLERIMSRYPSPFMVTVMRDPVEKFASYIYYKAWLDKVVPSQEYFSENVASHWESNAEYTKTLGSVGDQADVNKAVEVLNHFHVVGITSDVAGLFAQIAHHLGLTAKDVAYLSTTTMPGRPKLESLSMEYQKEVYRVLATQYPGEIILYQRAEALHHQRMNAYKLHALRDEIHSLSKNPDDMDCGQAVYEKGVTAGGRTCIDPTQIRDA